MHTEGRWVLALSTIASAMSRSASRSTYTWQLPTPVSITGTVDSSTTDADQAGAAARDQHVDQPAGPHQRLGRLVPLPGHQLDHVGRQPGGHGGRAQHGDDGLLDRRALPADVVQLVPGEGHEAAKELMRARGLVDVLIPRGGAGLIRSVVEESTVPVIETGVGNCHVYVDRDADLDLALAIVLNAKTHRPSVCNAAESLLVHADVADGFVPAVVAALQDAGVTVHGDDDVRRAATACVPATEEDHAAEYLSLDISAAVVPDLDAAVAHIRRYSSGHTEAIVTDSQDAARRFTAAVDSAAVMVNASTRFTDGGEFGFGAEIGISTQKLHARGPMGLPEMTSTKYVVTGDGHVR